MHRSQAAERIRSVIANYGAEGDAYAASVKALADSPIHLKRLGPQALKAIRPYKANKHSRRFEWLKKVQDPSAYDIGPDRHTVRYRGLELRSGDYVMGNLRIPEDGILLSSLKERLPANHAGIFAVVTVDGQSVPGVLEMAAKGNRFVPLSNFLGPHLYYGEVYRPRGKTLEWRQRVAEEVVKLQMNEVVSYDFQGRSTNLDGSFVSAKQEADSKEVRSCATCVGIPEAIYRRTGFTFTSPKTELTEGAKRNVRELGAPELSALSLPSDIVRSGNFEFVGAVDNRVWKEDLARELTMGGPEFKGSGGHHFNHRRLDLTLVNKGLLGSKALWLKAEGLLVKNNGRLAQAIKGMIGYQVGEIPVSVPFPFVSFFLSSSEALRPVSEALAKEAILRTIPSNTPFLIDEFQRDLAVSEKVRDLVEKSGLPGWYVDAP